MKRFSLFILLIFTALLAFSQQNSHYSVGDTIGIWQEINFDTAFNHLYVDSSETNIWQIGTPQKSNFNQAYSFPNAITTDTLNPYPANNVSYFDYYVSYSNSQAYPYIVFIDLQHKFDTDTLMDGGFFTVTWDKGMHWMNVIHDSIYGTMGGLIPGWSYIVPEPNLYSDNNTLFNGEFGFSGKSDGWINTTLAWHFIHVFRQDISDTMIVRFNFISDEIDNPKEGWMIDNIRSFALDVGSDLPENKDDSSHILISPNPLKTSTEITFKSVYKSIEISVYDTHGKFIEIRSFSGLGKIIFERNSLPDGVYFLKIRLNGETADIKKIIISQ
jgi:hypothetical protein